MATAIGLEKNVSRGGDSTADAMVRQRHRCGNIFVARFECAKVAIR